MMSERKIVFWLVVGLIISVIDCWLSVQSMFGVLAPSNALSTIVAVLMGISLTAIAVLAPIFKDNTAGLEYRILWLVILLADIGTSILGAIWYGIMGKSLNSKIVFSEITYDPGNWFVTVVFVVFVLVVAGCCFKFGQALNLLNRMHRTRKPVSRASGVGG